MKEYQISRMINFDAKGLPSKEQRHIFTDYSPGLLVRTILEEISILSNPRLFGNMNTQNNELEKIDPKVEIFFHLKPAWHQLHQIERHFLCEGQRYNHIPGNIYLSFKDVIANSFKKYAKKYEGRKVCFQP